MRGGCVGRGRAGRLGLALVIVMDAGDEAAALGWLDEKVLVCGLSGGWPCVGEPIEGSIVALLAGEWGVVLPFASACLWDVVGVKRAPSLFLTFSLISPEDSLGSLFWTISTAHGRG